MKIYSAAIHSNGYAPGGSVYIKLSEREQAAVRDLKCDLESYYYVKSPRLINHLRTTGIKVFLDSGAYSAHTLGVDLSLDDYCRYIKEHDDILRVEDGIKMVSVLDGIGDALLTYQNQCAMERQGIRPLPCFHVLEDERYLEYYVANYDYITLGGMVGARPEALKIWLDRIWTHYLVDGAGRPKVKVHGFGITSLKLMHLYPWASCDSSSWIQSASFGAIVILYRGKYTALQISSESPFRHVRGQHFKNMTDIEREFLEDLIVSRGYDVDRLGFRYEARAAFNIESFDILDQDINTYIYRPEMYELF